jgi:Glutathione S-transferase
MKLYYAPGACSLSPHIALRELGQPFDLVKVDTKTHTFDGGGDFYGVNAKGYVPVLELDDGTRLTEGPAIVQYLADKKPDSGLAPKAGTLERVRLQEWLNFLTSEVHKGFSPLFSPETPEDYKPSRASASRTASTGSRSSSPASSTCWATASPWRTATSSRSWVDQLRRHEARGLAGAKAYRDGIASRPAVREALKAEGLAK